MIFLIYSLFFFFNHPATTEIYTLSLHDALPISHRPRFPAAGAARSQGCRGVARLETERSEEHTSELQSRQYLVCRLLLEKKKKKKQNIIKKKNRMHCLKLNIYQMNNMNTTNTI